MPPENRYRILIVEDSPIVRSYALKALKGFSSVHAWNPEQARQAVFDQERKFGTKNPFHLISCDVNMPHRGRTDTQRLGVELMKWLHKRYPNIPIICHSDDVQGAKQVPFAHFQRKKYVGNEEFNLDQALLHGKALELLEGKKSFDHVLYIARRMKPIADIEVLKIPRKLAVSVRTAKRTQDFTDLYQITQSGYYGETKLRDILRFCLSK